MANEKTGDGGPDLTKVRDLRNVLFAPRETGRRKAPETGGGPTPLSEFRRKALERTGKVWVTPMDGMQDASRWPARDGDSSAGKLIFRIFAGSGVDIAAGDGKLDGLPRRGSGRIFDGVCPFLENSTVC